MRPGIYERLVREGEEAELQQLEAAEKGSVEKGSVLDIDISRKGVSS